MLPRPRPSVVSTAECHAPHWTLDKHKNWINCFGQGQEFAVRTTVLVEGHLLARERRAKGDTNHPESIHLDLPGGGLYAGQAIRLHAR